MAHSFAQFRHIGTILYAHFGSMSLNTNHTIHIKEGGYLSPSLFAVIHLYALVASALTELKYATAATLELL